MQRALRGMRYEVAAIAGAILVLWQMLLPGYVLTLDLVFGTHTALANSTNLKLGNFVVTDAVHFAEIVVPGWIVEKAMLFGLFFALFYLPLRFYPWSREYGQEWLAAIFFAINPFVYERFLAGQWEVLASYACLFPVVAYLIRFLHDRSWRSILCAYLWLFLDGVFALHLFVMGSLLMCIFGAGACIDNLIRRDWPTLRRVCGRFFLGGAALMVASTYWLVPSLILAPSTLASFTSDQWMAFSTAGNKIVGTIPNVAMLYGFWGEHEVWASQSFFTQASWPILWIVLAVLLGLVITVGIVLAVRSIQARVAAICLIVASAAAFVFSTGVGPSIFFGFNTWLFTHVSFWSGFRDSQKWSALLALTYALFFAFGGGYLISRFHGRMRASVFAIIALLPITYMPLMLLGFAGQLQDVWYPSSWADANAYLSQQSDCSAVFLPWQEYYQPVFTKGILIANPASGYFNCDVTTGKDLSIDGVGSPQGLSPGYYAIEQALEDNTIDPDQAVAMLQSQGIRYIIYTDDLLRVDPYRYEVLRSTKLSLVFQEGDIDIYRLGL